MNAEIKPSYDVKRQKLSDIIPLDSPFTIYIEPTKRCNFKCFYCMHSTRDDINGEIKKTGYELKDIEETFFEKIVKEIMNFPTQPKRIVFSGLGEPLMNSKLPSMVKRLREAGFEGRIDVITNGVLLNKKMADDLVEAGISRIQISLQGLTKEQYNENCGVPIDFEKFIDNLKYLYENKKNAKIFIKIIDALLKNKEDENKFYEIFGKICDTIYIEHLIVLEQQMGDHGGKVDRTKNFNNEKFEERFVCPVIFYHLQIAIGGECFPCPVPGLNREFSLGNAKELTLNEIWNGKKRHGIMKAHLMKNKSKLPVCSTCDACAAVLDENENLDNDCDMLLNKLGGIEK